MRFIATVVCLVPVALLSSCDTGNKVSEADLALGAQCFERHRASLAPGTQYEGVEGVTDDQVSIRIMDGLNVVTIGCPLNPDRTLQDGGE
jgi:hypothetical protein